MSHNRLSKETSPYLLQHKDNPVHWWPWGDDAFAEARKTGKPVLLSVGYAACHWCHVMAHESFEDAATAAIMNELFVNIKVDREERPDVDSLYMTALHHLGEQGGWPLTMFLTAQGEPFWGGTYFPKEQIYGRPPFTHVLREISKAHREEFEKIRANADALKNALQPRLEARSVDNLNVNTLSDLSMRLSQALDPHNGGLVGAPKFPNCVILGFLWKMGLQIGHQPSVDGVEKALIHISQGGIYDHLGGGFARYSVDDKWLVPHFEKMLYDNALLVDLMTEVWKERRNPLLQARIAETVEWLMRDMRIEGGGFASSYDADSEGVEGKYYVWSKAEITALLGEADAAFFCEVYDAKEDGNWEHTNILNRLNAIEMLSPTEEDKLEALRGKLLEAREARIRPGWDDKALTDWNGLAISALLNAGATFGQKLWVDAAKEAYVFIKSELGDENGRLRHSWRAGQAKTPGIASDYSNMIAAAIDVFLVTDDPGALEDAERWCEAMQAHFLAEPHGGYYLSADDTKDIPIRTLSARDDAVPNANAIMMANFAALFSITGKTTYRDHAEALKRAFSGEAMRFASLHTGFFSTLADHLMPQHIVLMRGEGDALMREALTNISLPGSAVQWLYKDDNAAETSPAFGKQAIDGKATAYICNGPQCSPPVTKAGDLLSMLQSMRLG